MVQTKSDNLNIKIIYENESETIYVKACDVVRELGYLRAGARPLIKCASESVIKHFNDGSKGLAAPYLDVYTVVDILENQRFRFRIPSEFKYKIVLNELKEILKSQPNQFGQKEKETKKEQVSFIKKEPEITLTQKELEDLIQNNVKQEVDKILEQKEKSSNSKKGLISKILKLII